ncbi:major facilitator superfamily domain-containing protein [Aspergillus pseudonomiae]|uniref:Major facilitator superfamily domain-containing protein n=1 Tax=Aspergillus pseudonomiae TaxID=1506151 RepID=A0A5N7D2X3_9EURO|nr:major facilitator superfamily domain-containing protein [Aspergillus pseudonomiae]KAE8400760.1 major facilitator superfamily domain-containing protein [Aspergillus pseudonomiae]
MTSPSAEANLGQNSTSVDADAERAYRRKVDLWVLPMLCLSNLANAKTDGLDDDLHFQGNDYSLLILLFYIPFGLFDLPWNLLIKRYSGRIMLSSMSVVWGILALCQCAAKDFGSLLAIRILLGIFEAGFFAGATFYLTLFYTRGEMGFRLAIVQSFAVLASAFSGLISFGVFQIESASVKGWQYLFIIEGGMTLIIGVLGFLVLPDNPQHAWFLNGRQREAATARLLRDSSSEVATNFNLKDCFQSWGDWQFPIWCIISFTYPVAYATAMNFFPLIVQRLGYSVVKTNLWTVAPNLVGAVVLLGVAKSSDYFRERTFHIVFSLTLSLVGMVILVAIDVLHHQGVAYFACFLMASGAYILSCLVHAWHNNNNVHENSRAANTGFLVGLGNLAGVVSAATFRTAYAPKYLPTLIATCCCNAVCIIFVTGLGVWMRFENRRRDQKQGFRLGENGVDTSHEIGHPSEGALFIQFQVPTELPPIRVRNYFRSICNAMKTHACKYPGCEKSFTRAEHLRRHALNHEQPRKGFTSRHMLRHDKRDEEAGGPGLGVLNTRKRTRRARDGTIIVRPSQREMRSRGRSTTASLSSGQDLVAEEEEEPMDEAPLSPPISGSDPTSLPIVETDAFLAPMMPGGPFEPYAEPIPGQFDAADGSFNLGLGGMGDFLSMDTATDFNLPFAATCNYNWLFDVASLDDAFHQFDFPLGFDTEPFPGALNPDYNPPVDKYDGPSALLEVASMMNKGQTPQSTLSPIMPDILEADWMSGTSFLGPSPPPHLPRLSENCRRGILSLVMQVSPVGIDGRPRTLDSPLLTLGALQSYCDLFFTRFNVTYPLVHQATFNPETIDPIFLAAVLFMGATYSTREAHQLAVGIHDKLRNQLLCHDEFSPQPEFWVLQTMLLIDCFGKMRAGPKQRERAQLFHCVLIKLIRRSNCCSIQDLPQLARSEDIDQAWRQAMDAEQRKRLAMLCFMWDTQHAVLFSQSLCMSAFEIRSCLPCSAAIWEASSAREWAHLAARETNRPFLTVLKGYITPGSVSRPRDLNVFARTVILHGLMSVSADLKRRDQTTLRSETPERVGAWTPRMSRSYVLWKVDFDADCLAMKLAQTADPRRFTGLKMAAHALYHASCLALSVEILDLQIVVGAVQILGRTVTPADQSRSQQNIVRWLHEDSGASTAVARHASHLLQDAVLSLHDWDQTDAFHFPWCLYLATLACWVFHQGMDPASSEPRMNTDLSSLIVMMTNCPSTTELAALSGKYDPKPLVAAMAQQLATVRWAVVHDAMKVLVALS